MSTVKALNFQIGQSVTATNNFTLYQPATPDGTVRLGNGNSGSVTDLVTLTSAGNLGIGTSSPAVPLQVTGEIRIYPSSGTGNLRFGSGGVEKGKLLVDSSSNMGFETAGTQRMTLDSSGNLGLGVTPKAWSSSVALQIGSSAAPYMGLAQMTTGTADGYMLWGGYLTGNRTFAYSTTGDAPCAYRQNAGAHAWFNAPSGTAGNAISFTQAMTLDASGNLLIGATSGPAGGARLRAVNNVTNIWDFGPNTGSSFVVYNPSQVGVYISSGNTSWTSTSDERLKENLIPIENAVSKVSTLRAVTGNFIADEEKRNRPFLIAQDVQAVLPEAVDASDPDKLGVQYTDTIPLLVAAIKELSAELNELKQKVNA